MGRWPGGAEVFHHTANVWCQQGTLLKAHSIQSLLLSKPSSVARTACPETVGHRSRASHPAVGSACQTGEAVDPLHHSPPLCCELTMNSCFLAGLWGCFGQGSIFPEILLQQVHSFTLATCPLPTIPHGCESLGVLGAPSWVPLAHCRFGVLAMGAGKIHCLLGRKVGFLQQFEQALEILGLHHLTTVIQAFGGHGSDPD